MTIGAVDYAASYFKYKTPTPIQGTPTNKTLKRLKQELRANASSVESDLGGGDHGYLGLVLTDGEYATVSATAFNAPAFPAPLAIPTGTDQVTALNLREVHKDSKRAYYECKNVEKALQRHVQDAIEDKYLESLIDEDTQLINADIPDVLKYLFETYGKVPSEEVKQKEIEIRAMSFHPADPMILLYNAVEKLKTMGEAADIAYTEPQLLDIALTVIRNTRDFEKALGEWEALRATAKTWVKFKKHFTTAQKQLKAIRGPTMQQAGYHHANMLAEQLKTDMERCDQELFSVIQLVVDTTASTASPPSLAPSEISSITPSQYQANAVQADPVQVEMLKILQQMQQSMWTQAQVSQQTSSNTTRQNRRTPRKTPDGASYPRRQTDTYCWTHGGSNHSSQACQRKAPGHQDEATFENRMGGSNAYCKKA